MGGPIQMSGSLYPTTAVRLSGDTQIRKIILEEG
jgi:hypothetical protein